MSKQLRHLPLVGTLLAIVMAVLLLAVPATTKAGIYDAGKNTTYKEYWISHKEFTAGCNPDGTPQDPDGNSWYLEPFTLEKCPKTLDFVLPDDFTNAVKVEIYIDLWRNYNTRAARFKLNNHATVYAPPVGSDWSRTPYVAEIPMSDLNVGPNSITFWGDKLYHVHDVAFRVYYTDENPLVGAPGSDVTPPNGDLVSIADDSGPVGPGAGGTLTVNNEKLTLKANVSSDAAFVEFHAWYEGYDEDNDGSFRDWHNLGRNNWFPGGTSAQPLGGVIDHIGTVKPNASGEATVVWDTTTIMNQALIKFKIRVVDAAGNVREAAGGESADFKLMRNRPVLGFIIPNFVDTGIHMDGLRPDSFTYQFTMPNTLATFDAGYLIGNYWRTPRFSINGTPPNTVSGAGDDWALGVKQFNKNALVAGVNAITYSYSGTGPGSFVERPGPLFLLRRNAGAASDGQAPAVSAQSPAGGATNVDVKSNITATITDGLYGVDWTSVQVTVNGEDVTGKIRLNGVASSYVMVYDPPQNLPFDTTIPVTVEACDLAGNCMTKVSYSFKTAAPDTAPPQISGLTVTTRPTGAKITWTTNEPATSRVDYGPTNAYELGNVSDAALVTSHTINLTGLEPNKLYHYKVTSADEQGNAGKTSDLTFKTPDYGDLVSDDFNECALDPSVWEFINPLNDASIQMNGETLQLMVPGGVAHDWKGGKKPPRVMQVAPNGDFTLDVKFNSFVNLLTQSQGVLVEETDGTYFYVSYEYVTDPADGLPKLFMYSNFVKDGVKVKGTAKALGEITNGPLFMRVQRTGDSWRWFYSTNGTSYTAANAAYVFAMAPFKIGFFAGNSGPGGGSPPAQAAILDYFFNKDKPIVPEDGKPIGINLTKNGNGTVTKDPDQPGYLCGTQVTVKAVPATGWQFTGWTGDFTNPNATAVVTVNGQMQIAGNFEAIPLNLTVNINNNGAGGAENKVQKNPDKETYVYDDEVTLTAVPQPGWSFVQWNGAVVGADPMKTLTMRKDETVTATFKQDQYTLNLQVINDGIGVGGTTTVTPKKTTYVYGDVVSLTATAADHWKFAGWTGDVESTDPTLEYTITGDTNIQARFVQDTFDLKVTIINGGVGEGGVVTLNPDKPKYVYGEVVALIADPNCGWTFTEWGGALSGNKPVEVLTITDNTAVTAKFTQEKYELNVTVDGPGNVKVQPKKDDYVCGDVVTLEAVPAPDNFFTGWSGDLTGAESPVEITIEGNTAITASFSDNQPPTFVPVDDQTVRVNQKVSFTVVATDPKGEKITLSVDGLPKGATFKDNGNGTGAFNWTPGVSDTGQYVVTFIASDGKGQGSAAMTITVGGNPVVIPVIVGP